MPSKRVSFGISYSSNEIEADSVVWICSCCSPFGFCGMTEDFCKKTDDEETSCQSNCDQPGSGSSNGNVRQRVVGTFSLFTTVLANRLDH